MEPEPARRAGLDLVRAVAILLVVGAHGLLVAGQPGPAAAPWFLRAGFAGVELFFVLSGYLIGTILLRSFDRPEGAALGRFWARRWLRTLPPYYLVVAGLFLLRPPPERIGGASYWTFTQNLAWPIPGWFDESWSLAVEEWFYLTLPLVLLALAGRRPGPNRLLAGILAYVALGTGLRAWLATGADVWDDQLRKVVLARLDGVGHGVLVAWAAWHHPAWVERRRVALALIGLALSALALSRLPLDSAATPLEKTLLLNLNSLGMSCLLPWCVPLRLPGPARLAAEWVSKTSYAMYLLHASLALRVVKETGLTGRAGLLPAALVYVGLTLLASSAMYVLFERPVLRLRDRLVPDKRG